MTHTGIVNAAELHSLGINPECIMTSQRNFKNFPIDVQFGLDRIVRCHMGSIQHYFGYYDASQIRSRQILSQIMRAEFEKCMRENGSTFLKEQSK